MSHPYYSNDELASIMADAGIDALYEDEPVPGAERCRQCNGTGMAVAWHLCAACHGTGSMTAKGD